MNLSHNKRGVEITLQTVIIAVLVLIVLIVLVVIFLKGTGGFLGGVTSCQDRGGTCASDSESCISSGGSVYRLGKCDSGVCCIPQDKLSGTNQNDLG
jgi:hypothetical protein